MNFNHNLIFDLQEERSRQVRLYGLQDIPPEQYLAILGEEYGEACQAANDACKNYSAMWDEEALQKYREELIQVATVALAAAECVDRGLWLLREKTNFGK